MLPLHKIPTQNKRIRFSAVKSNKFKSSVISFSMTVPLTKEAVICDLLLSGLLRRGTESYPSMSDLNRSLDELYGSYVEIRSSLIGNNISLIITAEVLDNKYIPDGTDALGGVMDIVSDIILHPLLNTADFDKTVFLQEKRIIEDNIAAEKNNTRSYSVKRCAELLACDVSLAPTYSEMNELLKRISFEDVLAHYRRLVSSAYVDVFYIGATDPSVLGVQLDSTFSQLPENVEYSEVTPLTAYNRSSFICDSEKMAVSQGKLALGFSTGVIMSKNDDSYYTALMLNEILGGSPSSKLFINVREKMSLCYYCASSFSIYTGAMMVSSGIDISNLETVKSAILHQIDEIKAGNITKAEINAARLSITNSYRQLYDSPFDLQSFYSGRALLGISDNIEDCIRKLSTVSVEDVTKLASRLSLDAMFYVESSPDVVDSDAEEDCEND